MKSQTGADSQFKTHATSRLKNDVKNKMKFTEPYGKAELRQADNPGSW